MNYNDALAQQQAMLNQAMQNYQHGQWAAISFLIGYGIVVCFVIYLFYARLRDIADELRKFRIAFEFANTPLPRAARRGEAAETTSTKAEAQGAESADRRYMPK